MTLLNGAEDHVAILYGNFAWQTVVR